MRKKNKGDTDWQDRDRRPAYGAEGLTANLSGVGVAGSVLTGGSLGGVQTSAERSGAEG